MHFCLHLDSLYRSLPSRERGLKCSLMYEYTIRITVAPFAGAWIEIGDGETINDNAFRRSLRGSVD